MVSQIDTPETTAPRSRIVAIDALRGLIMVLMALDHNRDFLGDMRIRPDDPATTTTALFLTRWVTHLCAPTFLFLAGFSAYMYGTKVESRRQLSIYLIIRGLWLLFLEFTVVRFSLLAALNLGPFFFIVIAAIGSSMILLGLACWLPDRLVLLLGVAIVCGHNVFDSVSPEDAQSLGPLWNLFLRPGYVAGLNTFVAYPILPWFGLMATGYGLAPFVATSLKERSGFVFCFGLVLLVSFVALRSLNAYGDPQRWSYQPAPTEVTDSADTHVAETNWLRTSFSFLATSKYPPSLLFVLMTIGVTMLLLVVFERLGKGNAIVRFLSVFGAVPLFFYILHFYLLHAAAFGLYWVRKGVLISPMRIDVWTPDEIPAEYGFNGPNWLVQVYAGWIVVLTILFPLCLAYRAHKRRAKSQIWSYL